ncbi:MAG: nucleotide exchange factor GrpE [Gammaproteobacteria bacterium]
MKQEETGGLSAEAETEAEQADDSNDAAASTADESAGAASAEALQQQLESLTLQAEANLDKAMRAGAELDNMRKRAGRDIENAHKYALEKFVQELLPVLDSMQLGMDAAESADDLQGLKQGMDLTLKMLGDCLEKFGVTAHDPCGEQFNPELHEAVSTQQQQGAKPGQIISVMQKGYDLNGRLIRPAMVVVAK